MVGTLQPLTKQMAIVNEDGTPNDYFIRWAQQRQIDISGGVTMQQVQDYVAAVIAGIDITGGTNITVTGSLSAPPVVINWAAELGDLSDVDLVTTPPVDGNVLKYVAADDNWVPGVGGGGGGGALSVIQQQVIGSAVPSVSFSGIPASNTDLFLVITGRTSAALSTADLLLNFNADTGNNYDWIAENRFGTASGNGVAFMRVGDLVGTSSPSDYPTNITIDIPAYLSPFYKGVNSRDEILQARNTGGMFGISYGGWWRNTAAITQIDVTLSSGNFVVGSILTLYGRG